MHTRTGSRSLPFYASTLFGREQDLALLEGLIRDDQVQLITITGSAGIGKTRIATQVARTWGEESVRFINLATVRDHTLVLPAIAQTLEVNADDLTERIREKLSTWSGIVVIDNFEQVIDAAPDIAEIMPQNPELTLIITSQRPLQIEGERVVRLAPLAVPEPDTELEQIRTIPSVVLLMDRARAQDSSAEESLQSESATLAIADICRKLDGIPLALELAASRLAILSPEAVLTQLEQGQSVLSSQRRDAPERQRTMHAAISWSYNLLPDDLQRLFLWLGTFTAGFNLEIVERLGDELGVQESSFDIVSELVNSSLVIRTSGGADPWYSMLVSIREFCLSELDDSDDRAAAEEFVAEYTVDLANRSEDLLIGPHSADWRARLNRELPTIRSTVEWALDHESPRVPMLIAGTLWRFLDEAGLSDETSGWINQSMQWQEKLEHNELVAGLVSLLAFRSEGRDLDEAYATSTMIEDLLQEETAPKLQAQFFMAMGFLEINQQHLGEAERWYERALQVSDAHGFNHLAARALGNLGVLAFNRGDHEIAEQRYVEVKPRFESLGDYFGTAAVLSNLAAVASAVNNPGRALAYLDEVEALELEHGLHRSRAYSLLNRHGALLLLGEVEASLDTARDALEVAKDLNDRNLVAIAHESLAASYLEMGDIPKGAANILSSLALVSVEESVRAYAESGATIAVALALSRKYVDAAQLAGKAQHFAESNEYVIATTTQQLVARHLEPARSSQPEVEAAWIDGAGWDDETYFRKLKLHAQKLAYRASGIIITVKEPDRVLEELTSREREILQLLLDGGSTQSMAEHLSVSPRTVTTHLGNIMAKLEVSSRAELVAKVIRGSR